MSNRKSTVQVLFHHLEVSTMSSNTGIFVGNNEAHAWSSHHKHNSGFGEAEGDIRGCTNIVFDNDYIDSPVDDRDHLIIHEKDIDSLNQAIGFKDINAGRIEANSTISIGANAQQGWSSHSKSNHGQGTAGINFSQKTFNYISDNDAVDTPIRSIGIAGPITTKKDCPPPSSP